MPLHTCLIMMMVIARTLTMTIMKRKMRGMMMMNTHARPLRAALDPAHSPLASFMKNLVWSSCGKQNKLDSNTYMLQQGGGILGVQVEVSKRGVLQIKFWLCLFSDKHGL